MVAGNSGKESALEKTKELTALRKLGHQLLLAAGDSTSLVLPVREISSTEFQLTFQNKFRLEPNVIVDLFRQHFPSQGDYAVEVYELNKPEILYSFVLSPDSAHTIVTCIGRVFPETHYTIHVKLPSSSSPTAYYAAGILLLLAGAGTWWYKKRAKRPVGTGSIEENAILLGKYRFDMQQQRLELGGRTIELTGKEAQLLNIFAAAPNTVIERSRLLKEVWNDEGVMVSRSLDMFVSRLRKKLEADPGVNLLNVHGKGYRLDVTAEKITAG